MTGKQISALELSEIIKNGLSEDCAIIDVRTPEEFVRGAIANSINIPLDRIMNQTQILNKYKKIYLYCLSGGRSELAALQLSTLKLPIELINLTGGLLAWRNNKLPLEVK